MNCESQRVGVSSAHSWLISLLCTTVTVVESGPQALEILRRSVPGTFQLILTVRYLSGMKGPPADTPLFEAFLAGWASDSAQSSSADLAFSHAGRHDAGG